MPGFIKKRKNPGYSAYTEQEEKGHSMWSREILRKLLKRPGAGLC